MVESGYTDGWSARAPSPARVPVCASPGEQRQPSPFKGGPYSTDAAEALGADGRLNPRPDGMTDVLICHVVVSARPIHATPKKEYSCTPAPPDRPAPRSPPSTSAVWACPGCTATPNTDVDIPIEHAKIFMVVVYALRQEFPFQSL